jgi:hypothetical protein
VCLVIHPCVAGCSSILSDNTEVDLNACHSASLSSSEPSATPVSRMVTMQSFLKERGGSSGLCLVVVLVLFSPSSMGNAGEAWGSRIGRKANRVAAVGPGGSRRAGGCCSVSEKWAGGCPVVPAGLVVVVVCSSAGGPRLVDRPEGGLSVIPSPRR